MTARRIAGGLVVLSAACCAQNYRAEQVEDHGVSIVRLTDAASGVEVSIVPSIGNRAYEMKVHGKNILHFSQADAGEYQKTPRLSGIPFLAPWADLLNEPAFWANGKRYSFNMELGNVRGNMPSHGLLVTSPYWRVTEVAADGQSARVTSRLEFWKHPELMAQWPFAHQYDMTYSLSKGVLEVKTTVANLSADAMPLAVGFHPFFQIPDIPREEWVAHLPARIHVIAGEHNIPTGEMRPLDLPNPLPLRGRELDDGFTDFERDAEGRAHFSIEAGGKVVEALFGAGYPVATIWLPKGREFICFEPLTTIISGVNLAHEGKYSGQQTIPAGGSWTGSFWIQSRGIPAPAAVSAAAQATAGAPQAAASAPQRRFELKEESARFWELFDRDAKLEKIATGFGFTEGPVWDPHGFLYVSDEEKNRLSRVYPDGRVETVLEIGDPDGSTLDAQGRLVTTASVLRAIIQVDPDGKYKVLADRFEGKKFNSPNDIVLGPDGALYFTDPTLDLPKGEKQELEYQGVFRLASDGSLRLLTKDVTTPNGLAFSPDGKRLYIDDTKLHEIRVYDVGAGMRLENGRLFAKEEGRGGAPDGIRVDKDGNVYCTGPGGVWVWDPEGHHLGTVMLPESTANFNWGERDYSTIYFSSRTSIYRLKTKARGFVPGAK